MPRPYPETRDFIFLDISPGFPGSPFRFGHCLSIIAEKVKNLCCGRTLGNGPRPQIASLGGHFRPAPLKEKLFWKPETGNHIF